MKKIFLTLNLILLSFIALAQTTSKGNMIVGTTSSFKHSTLTSDGGDDSESTDMDGFRTIDTGLNLGAGFAATESLNINLGYQLGLTSIDEDGDLDAKNTAIHFGVTYLF